MEVTEIKKKYYEEIKTPGSERNLISILLNDNDKIIDCEEAQLYAEHFAVDAHRYIYMSTIYLYETDQAPTPLAIMEVLADDNAKQAIKDIGGLEYLQALADSGEKSKNIDIYIKKIKQTYTRRLLFNISLETITEMTSDSSKVLNPNELVASIQRKIDEIAVEATGSEEVYKMGTTLEERLKAREENPMEVPGLETGFYQFDLLTNGMQGGDLMFVCARSKTGKSVILTNWAKKISIDDRLPILYIDTEMNDEQVEDRILAMESGVPEKEIKSGMYVVDTAYGKAEEKVERIKRAREKLNMGQFYHIYMPQYTLEKIVAITRKFKMKFNIVALFFDYIKVTSNQTDSLKSMQEYQQLGFIANGLKDLAGILDIPVYSAVQANRNQSGVESDEMDERDIAGSDRILQNASKLVFLANKSEEKIALEGGRNGNQTLRVKFQRNGECDCSPIGIQFDREIIRMSEVG